MDAMTFSIVPYPQRQRWNPKDQNGGSIGFYGKRWIVHGTSSSPRAYTDDIPVLFNHVLYRRTREHVQINDPANGRVGERRQRLQGDVHRVGIEQKLSVKLRTIV